MHAIIIIAMKRMKFDPLIERRQLRRHSDVTPAVKARVQDLSGCVNALISTSELPELNGADQLLKDVIQDCRELMH